MPDEYALYEAKARLSSLVRQVREGRSVIITVHGVPAAELRPVDPSVRPQTLEERLSELDARSAIVPARRSPSDVSAFPRLDQRHAALSSGSSRSAIDRRVR